MEKYQEVGERIELFISRYELTAASFAERVGIKPSAVTHFINKRNKPSFDVISAILRAYPRLNPDWLILGQGAIWRDSEGFGASVPLRDENQAVDQQKSSINQKPGGGHPVVSHGNPQGKAGGDSKASLCSEGKDASLPFREELPDTASRGSSQDKFNGEDQVLRSEIALNAPSNITKVNSTSAHGEMHGDYKCNGNCSFSSYAGDLLLLHADGTYTRFKQRVEEV